MMKKTITTMTMLAIVSAALPALAASTKGTITQIRRTSSQIQVYLNVESGTSCGGSPFYYNVSSSQSEDWFRLINGAFLSGRTVWFTLTDTTDCRITAVRVYQ